MSGPVAGRRDRKKTETRQALLEAAHRLFAEKGFSRTTIDDIAEAADVSRRTFFRYYDSKDDLLRADIADLLPVMLGALRSRPAEEPPLAAILAALRTLIGPEGPPALAQTLASPLGGLRARLSLIRMLADWEQGLADTLLAREGIDSPTDEDRLRAVVTACAATSALRASAQIYRGRYHGPGLDTARFLPIVEQAFATLLRSGRLRRRPHLAGLAVAVPEHQLHAVRGAVAGDGQALLRHQVLELAIGADAPQLRQGAVAAELLDRGAVVDAAAGVVQALAAEPERPIEAQGDLLRR
jgi:AcrR family transcriptional regulator